MHKFTAGALGAGVGFIVVATVAISIQPDPSVPAPYTGDFQVVAESLGTTTPAAAPTITAISAKLTPPNELPAIAVLMNAVRAEPLAKSNVLTPLAAKRVHDLCTTHTFNHDGFRDYFDATNYNYIGENLARNFADTQSIFDAFMASPTHKANILNAKYSYVGVATECGIVVVLFGGYSS